MRAARRSHNLTVRLSTAEFAVLSSGARALSERLGVRVGAGTLMRMGGLARAQVELAQQKDEKKEAVS